MKKVLSQKEAYERAEGLLVNIAALKTHLDTLEKITADKVRAAARPYLAQANYARQQLGTVERALAKLSKGQKGVFFPDDHDRVDLKNGALLYKVLRPVKRVRGLLAKLQARGLKDAIKTTEKVDWDALEKWSKEDLADIGTERKKVELYEYELKR